VNLVPLAVLAAWTPLPAIADKGYSAVEGVRARPLAVFVAGAAYDTTTVKARAVDVRTGRWRRVPAVPLHWRANQAVVAAGRRVIVWGGASNLGRHRDGAMLVDGAWRRIARAPIASTRAPVWDGREVLVPAGAAYDPATNRWRRIARAPFGARVAVWTGTRMLIAAGLGEAAAYDPRRDRWTRVARPPYRARDVSRAVWTGTRMLVFNGRWAAAYNPVRDRWRLLGRPPLSDRDNFTAVWDGRRLLVWGGERRGRFLADGAAYSHHGWRRLPRAPLAPRDRHPAVPIRGGMVVWAGWGRRDYAGGAILRFSAGSRAGSSRCS
jgi:hypothetical protein